MRPQPFRTSIACVAVLAAACSGSVEERWPDTGVTRYRGPTARSGGESRAQGEWHFWYPDGTLHAEGVYERGGLPAPEDLGLERTRIPAEGRTGRWTFWDPAGRRAAEGRYEQGLRDHLWVCWYDNGRQCCTGHFELGLAHGYHVTWYPDGSKREERTYAEGLLEGPRTVWDEEGRPIWTGVYRDGDLVPAARGDVGPPPIHDVGGCALRAEQGHPRGTDVVVRGH